MDRRLFIASTAAGLGALAAPLSAAPIASVAGRTLTLGSDGVLATWSIEGGMLRAASMRDRITGTPSPSRKSSSP